MRILLIIFLAGITFSVSAQQPSEEDAVKEVLNRFFMAMENGDTTLVRLSFDYSARLQTVRINPQNKKTALDNETVDGFIKQVASIKTRNLRIEERIANYEVRTDGPLATVWAPYEFYIEGKLSHKGVNAFQLFKSPGGWKIIQICDTRHKGF